jgi:hypothetical protein
LREFREIAAGLAFHTRGEAHGRAYEKQDSQHGKNQQERCSACPPPKNHRIAFFMVYRQAEA